MDGEFMWCVYGWSKSKYNSCSTVKQWATQTTQTLIGAATVRLSTESLCATHSGVSLW